MPLSKFFHKRNSLKNKGDSQLTTKEISELASKAAMESATVATDDCHKTESDESTSVRKSSASSEDSESKSVQKPNRSKNRSTSCKESRSACSSKESRSASCKASRKRSEGLVQASSTDDEGFSDRTIHLKEKDLEKVIGQYVDKLIRESIVSAVKSVDLDNLCEEVIKDVSSRSQSESSEGTVEQRRLSKSVSEYVELEDDSFETKDYLTSEESSCEDEKRAEQCPSNRQGDGRTKGDKRGLGSDGYQADVEESESCLSMHMESSSDEMKVKENLGREETSSDDTKIVECEGRVESGSSEETSRKEIQLKEDPKVVLKTLDVSETSKEVKDDSAFGQESVDLKENKKDVTDSSLLKATTDDDSDSSTAEKADYVKDRIDSGLDQKSVDLKDSEKDVQDSSLLRATTDEDSDSSAAAKADSDNERKQSESKDSEDSESLSADEYGRKDTLKAPEQPDLILMDDGGESQPQNGESSLVDEPSTTASDLVENLPQKTPGTDDEKKVNWKMGYLHVKLPHKARGKGNLKVWKKRCVAFQADEFSPEPSLMMSVYSAESSKHSAHFWRSVSGAKAVVYRSSSRSHRYAFTVAEDGRPLLHLAADCEAAAQEWMAAARAVLWPPSSVVQLEKMLKGSEFEVSLIDNEFSLRAGLLGMYGYMTITPKKLILVHPHQGYVIQEWYLNTVDRFQLVQQPKIEDVHKVLAMTTCSDSSTVKGEILIYCTEAVTLLQSLAATIHQMLTYHSSQEGGIYQKELEAMAEWLVVSSPPEDSKKAPAEDYYKVPRQVKSLLDIPNFIFDKPLTCTSSGSEVSLDITPKLDAPDDFLNCSVTSFRMGGGQGVGKSSDSELSDSYTPPQSPAVKTKDPISKLSDQK